MGAAIGQVLPYAIGVAISPIPMIAVVLMLTSKRGGENGLAFLAGSAIGLTLIGAAVLLLAGENTADAGGASDSAGAINFVVGAALIVLAVRNWRKRPPSGEEGELPSWMDSVDHFNPLKALGLALALSVINFKNLLLTIAAATAISQTTSSAGDEAVALATFVLLAVIGPATPVIIYFAAGDNAPAKLAGMKDWLAKNNAAIIAVILLLIGAKVLGDGITTLSS